MIDIGNPSLEYRTRPEHIINAESIAPTINFWRYDMMYDRQFKDIDVQPSKGSMSAILSALGNFNKSGLLKVGENGVNDITDVLLRLITRIHDKPKDIKEHHLTLKTLLLNHKAILTRKTQMGLDPLKMLWKASRQTDDYEVRGLINEVIALYISVSPNVTGLAVNNHYTKMVLCFFAIISIRGFQAMQMSWLVNVLSYPIIQLFIFSASICIGYLSTQIALDYINKRIDPIILDPAQLCGSFSESLPFAYFGARTRDVLLMVDQKSQSSFKGQYDIKRFLLTKYHRLKKMQKEGSAFERYVTAPICIRQVQRAYDQINLSLPEYTPYLNTIHQQIYQITTHYTFSHINKKDIWDEIKAEPVLQEFLIGFYELADKGAIQLKIEEMLVLDRLVSKCIKHSGQYKERPNKPQKDVVEHNEEIGKSRAYITPQIKLSEFLEKAPLITTWLYSLAVIKTQADIAVPEPKAFGFNLALNGSDINMVNKADPALDAISPDVIRDLYKAFASAYQASQAKRNYEVPREHNRGIFEGFIKAPIHNNIWEPTIKYLRTVELPKHDVITCTTSIIVGLGVYMCAYTFLNVPLYCGVLLLYSYPTLRNGREDMQSLYQYSKTQAIKIYDDAKPYCTVVSKVCEPYVESTKAYINSRFRRTEAERAG